MIHQSFFKIAVLFSAFCLSTRTVFSLVCAGGFEPDHSGNTVCWTDHTSNSQRNCKSWSCWNGGNKWTQLYHCRPKEDDGSGESAQNCEDYYWVGTENKFSCTNHAQYEYYCALKPTDHINYITCSNCES